MPFLAFALYIFRLVCEAGKASDFTPDVNFNGPIKLTVENVTSSGLAFYYQVSFPHFIVLPLSSKLYFYKFPDFSSPKGSCPAFYICDKQKHSTAVHLRALISAFVVCRPDSIFTLVS